MNPEIRYLEITQSTNDDALKWASAGAAHGCAIVAQQQVTGRGRLGKQWFSPAGKNLYCSIVVRPEIDPREYPKLTLVAGLAVAEFLEAQFPVSVGLKWPNDLFISKRKCAGILCESSLGPDSSQSFAVIGVGLNINLSSDELPAELSDSATSLVIEGCQAVNPIALFPNLRTQVLLTIAEFEQHGFLPIIKRWRAKDILYGKVTQWVNRVGDIVSGTSLGPDDEGILHVVDERSVIHEIISGDIKLARSS